jgi:two-component system OmpR family sensor kinase
MDGLQKRLKHSLQWRLSLWLSLAILGLAVAAGTLSFFGAQNEAHELQDDILRQVALLARAPDTAASEPGGADGDPESRLTVQTLTQGSGVDRRIGPLALPPTLADGLHTLVLAGVSYRVAVRTRPGGERIAVAQRTGVRDEIARDSALRTEMPLLVLVPILLLLVAALVRQMLRPVTRLAAEVDGRDETQLHALPEHGLPTEIRPFITAINRLLARAGQALQTQRRFVADAAHELRSPLAALSLQAERLDAAAMSEQARERLERLREGIERGRALLDQLLSLARAQRDPATVRAELSLRQAWAQVLEDLMPLAETRGIDIGLAEGEDTAVVADASDLHALLKNLIDNAIRYAPPGGQVELSAKRAGRDVVVQIEDDGPGIAEAERSRVLDPFYRVLGTGQTGSGLGLAIAAAVVQRLGGRIELAASTRFAHGLKITVTLPAVPTAEG